MTGTLLVLLALQAAPDTAARIPDTVRAAVPPDTVRAALGAPTSSIPPRIIVELSNGGENWYKDLIPALIAAVVALAGAAGGYRVGQAQLQQKDREITVLQQHAREEQEMRERELTAALDRQLDEEERRHIAEELNTFYYPLKRNLDVSKLLHQKLVESQPEPDRKSFRTLIALLQGHEFTGNERSLIREIIATTRRIRRLILRGGALVTDPGVSALLATAAFHFRVLELAESGTLSAPDAASSNMFEDAVYPRGLNPALEQEIARLQQRLTVLTGRRTATDDGTDVRSGGKGQRAIPDAGPGIHSSVTQGDSESSCRNG
jgi:hypothetical protein